MAKILGHFKKKFWKHCWTLDIVWFLCFKYTLVTHLNWGIPDGIWVWRLRDPPIWGAVDGGYTGRISSLTPSQVTPAAWCVGVFRSTPWPLTFDPMWPLTHRFLRPLHRWNGWLVILCFLCGCAGRCWLLLSFFAGVVWGKRAAILVRVGWAEVLGLLGKQMKWNMYRYLALRL